MWEYMRRLDTNTVFFFKVLEPSLILLSVEVPEMNPLSLWRDAVFKNNSFLKISYAYFATFIRK